MAELLTDQLRMMAENFADAVAFTNVTTGDSMTFREWDGLSNQLARWLVGRFDPADPDRLRDRSRLDWVRTNQQAQAAEYFSKVAASWDAQRNLHVPESAVEAAILDAVGEGRVDLLYAYVNCAVGMARNHSDATVPGDPLIR